MRDKLTIHNATEGERVVATRQISWTLGEFEDYPLIVERGDEGVVSEVLEEQSLVFIRWDKDPFVHMRKSVRYYPTDGEGWPLRGVQS